MPCVEIVLLPSERSDKCYFSSLYSVSSESSDNLFYWNPSLESLLEAGTMLCAIIVLSLMFQKKLETLP